MSYPRSFAKDGTDITPEVHRTLVIELYKIKKPIGIPNYSHEAIISIGADREYFYGHSDEEVLAKILVNRLEKS